MSIGIPTSISRPRGYLRAVPGRRGFWIGAFAALFVFLAVNESVGRSEFDQERPEPPDPSEVYVLEELREWVRSVSPGRNGSWFSEPTLAAAIQRRAASFELFRGLDEAEAQRILLLKLPYGELIWKASQHDALNYAMS